MSLARRPKTGLLAYLFVVYHHAVNSFSALCLALALVVVLPWWKGPWSIPTAATCAAASLVYATYLSWREALLAAFTSAYAAPEFSTLRSSAESILYDELDQSLRAFRGSVASAVAEYGATGNRYSSALVDRLEGLGLAELENEGLIILRTWRLLLQPILSTLGHETLAAAANTAEQQLAGQRLAIQELVNAVDMRRAPRNSEFLVDSFPRCAARLRAELEVGLQND